MPLDTQQVTDFDTMLRQALGEFREECVTKARQFRLYFVKRDALKVTITSIRRDVPTGTKASPAPGGVPASKWKSLIDTLAAAEKLLREEAKKVKPDAPAPPPVTPPVTSGPTAAKRTSRRREARERLKNRLNSIYGKEKGKLRYRVYAKMAKEAGQEGSPQAMWSYFNGEGVEDVRAKVAARSSGSAAPTATDATDATALAPVDGAQTGGAAGTTPTGLMASLWPTDKPIYMRPAAIVGAVAVVGIVGWVLLSPPKPKPAPRPASKAATAPVERSA